MKTIYFADLTHCTVTISNDSFPLGIGLISSYFHKFHPDIEIELFKYPDSLKKAIDKKIPDIVGFSNYPWNTNFNMSFLKYIKNLDKSIITVMGGPNISYEPQKQLSFLLRFHKLLDFYCMFEGESSFLSLYENALKLDFDLVKMKSVDIPGCLYIKKNEKNETVLSDFQLIERKRQLEEIPSPYLNGYMDKFFDGMLTPMIETHRGCPFTCTFCHEGHDNYKKVNRHEVPRVIEEIRYIAGRVGNKVNNLLICDPNFGMYDRDLELAKELSITKIKTGYPSTIFSSTAKNVKEKLLKITTALKGIHMPVWMSPQSMDSEVLKNIRRTNISVAQMVELQKDLDAIHGVSLGELILCLPGETFKSHCESLFKLIDLKIGSIGTYQLMLVNGSEMVDDSKLNNIFKVTSKFRVIPRSFTKMDGMETSFETEEIIVSTKDMSFDEYIKARQFHLLISIFYNQKIFYGFFKLVFEYGLNTGEFFYKIFDLFTNSPHFQSLNSDYIKETREELFDSEEEIYDFYMNDENYQQLVEGSRGANLLQKYTSLAHMEKSEFLITTIAEAAFLLNSEDEVYIEKNDNIKRYYTLAFKNIMGSKRMNEFPSDDFSYDIHSWVDSNKRLDDFNLPALKKIRFGISDSQYNLVETYFNRYGRDFQAFGKILTILWIGELLRKPISNASIPIPSKVVPLPAY